MSVEFKVPRATLVSHTEYPLETLYVTWLASRSVGPVPDTKDLYLSTDDELHVKIADVAWKVINDDIPVAETISFTFCLEDVPIALREQLVRNRIGHKFGDNYGVDIYTNSAESSFWSQTMRMLDMSTFAENGEYFVPESVQGSRMFESYQSLMTLIETTYRLMVENGISPEDARMVIPLAATSRISWTVNLQSLKRILSKRGCWIAQLGMWKPLLTSVVEELATKIHPMFRRMIAPPCTHEGKFTMCPYENDAMNRVRKSTKDPEPPCPLFLENYQEEVFAVPTDDRTCTVAGGRWFMFSPEMQKKFELLCDGYEKLWDMEIPGTRT